MQSDIDAERLRRAPDGRRVEQTQPWVFNICVDEFKYEADAGRLANEIAKYDEDISTREGDFRAATKVREIDNADYIATH